MGLHTIALNNLRRRKGKMLLILLALTVGIGTIISVFGVVEGMKTEMSRQAADYGINMVITPDAGGLTFTYGGITLPEILYDRETITDEDVERLQSLPSYTMIRAAAPKLMGVKQHKDHPVLIVGTDAAAEFALKPWLRLEDSDRDVPMREDAASAEDMEKKISFEELELERQDLAGLEWSDHQIILGSALAQVLNLKPGDTFVWSEQEFVVSGVLLESGTVQDQQMLMPLNTAQALLNRPNEISVIEMAADYLSGSEEVFLKEINEALPHVQVSSLRQQALRRDEMLTRMVRFGTAISVLILLIGLLVISMSLLGAVRERTREIGILRALGFRRYHIAAIILMEGSVMSIIGGITGYLIGMLTAQWGGPLLSGLSTALPWRADWLLLSLALSVVIGLLSSLYPAYTASSLDPAEALRFI